MSSRKLRMRNIQEILSDLMILLSKIKFTDKNISMYYNKKGELIVKINVGVV